MTTPDPAAAERSAVYVIRIAGPVGPVVVSSLADAGAANPVGWDVRTGGDSVVLVSVTEDDLVDVVRRLTEAGLEIGSVRELGACDD